MMAWRGVQLTYETVREWCDKFTPENDSREILTRGLIFELRRLSIGRKESANRGSANPNLFRNLPFGQTFTEEFLNLLQV
jgi:hypothetical protein